MVSKSGSRVTKITLNPQVQYVDLLKSVRNIIAGMITGPGGAKNFTGCLVYIYLHGDSQIPPLPCVTDNIMKIGTHYQAQSYEYIVVFTLSQVYYKYYPLELFISKVFGVLHFKQLTNKN